MTPPIATATTAIHIYDFLGPYFNGRIPCSDHGDQGSTPCGPRCSVSATTTKKRTGFLHTYEDQWLVSVLFLGLYSNGKIPC